MLKIKNDVDLKELEKFGFKPKYNEDTGKIYKYIYRYEFYGTRKIAIEIEEKYYNIATNRIKERIKNGNKSENRIIQRSF